MKIAVVAMLLLCLASPAIAEDIIHVVYPTNMTVDEAGQVHLTVQVRLNVQPTGTISVRLYVPNPLDEVGIEILPGFLVHSLGLAFSPSDWTPKYVTLVGFNDSLDDGLMSWQVFVGSNFGGGGPLIAADVSGDNRFLGKGPWYGTGHTCDDDGGNDGLCGIE